MKSQNKAPSSQQAISMQNLVMKIIVDDNFIHLIKL